MVCTLASGHLKLSSALFVSLISQPLEVQWRGPERWLFGFLLFLPPPILKYFFLGAAVLTNLAGLSAWYYCQFDILMTFDDKNISCCVQSADVCKQKLNFYTLLLALVSALAIKISNHDKPVPQMQQSQRPPVTLRVLI